MSQLIKADFGLIVVIGVNKNDFSLGTLVNIQQNLEREKNYCIFNRRSLFKKHWCVSNMQFRNQKKVKETSMMQILFASYCNCFAIDSTLKT